jgi:hypothetical protein
MYISFDGLYRQSRQSKERRRRSKTRYTSQTYQSHIPILSLTNRFPNSLSVVSITPSPLRHSRPLNLTLPPLGLAYAYQYAQHISLPSDSARAAQRPWKFNKGRQNWIIRNVTDPLAIPDSYLALAMAYADSIKGGARDVSL